MKRITSVLVCLTMLLTLTFAQDVPITGKVTSSDDSSVLPGVSVVVKGTTTGTTTDIDGKFSLSAPSDATLVFSFIGMTTQEVAINNKTTIDIAMSQETTKLDEAIVVAYGTQKKSQITGSVATVKSEELSKVQNGNVLQGMEGKLSGVQVIQESGQPGSGPKIRIRGIGSINGSSAPLYVVDGVPFTGSLSSIDPMDIQSLTVLKDASANALYGHRGANGVIIVTTKKGRKNTMTITADVSAGVISRGTKDYDVMKEPAEYYEAYYTALRNYLHVTKDSSLSGASLVAARNMINDQDRIGGGVSYNNYDVPDTDIIDPTTGKVTSDANLLYHEDWSDFLFDNAYKQKAHISLNGGSEKSAYYLSVGYDANEGYALNSGFDRFSSRLSIDHNVTDFIKIGGTVSYSHTEQNAPVQAHGSGAYANLFNWARIVAPIYPIYAYDENGNVRTDVNGNKIYDFGDGVSGPESSPWTRYMGGNQNVYATTKENVQQNLHENLSSRFYGKINFLKDFSFTYNGSIDLRMGNNTRFTTPIGGDAKEANGRGYAYSNKSQTVTHQQLLDYKKDFNKHSVSLLLGHESSSYNYRYFRAAKTNFLLTDQYILDGAVKIQGIDNYERDYHVEGYLSRAVYSYADKYILNASFRRDGSSVFHPDNRWGNFWGVGLAYSISKESFMDNFSGVLNNLRLKASFGQQGNDHVNYDNSSTRNYYAYSDLYEIISNNDEIGIRLSSLGNKDLTWELSNNFNAGFESFWMNNRIGLNFEYFVRAVSDLIFNDPLPLSVGMPSIPRNVGDMENKGFEIDLHLSLINTKDLNWSLNINTTHYTNKITKLPDDEILDGNFQLTKGKSRYEYYLRRFAGVDRETGDALWYKNETETDGEGNTVETGKLITTNVYNEAERYYIGKTAIPDFFGGFSSSLTYKNIDFSIAFTYQLGGYGYDGIYYGLFDATEIGRNFVKDVNKAWTPENKDASLPRIDIAKGDQYNSSDLKLTDASYLSLKNISIGYTFRTDALPFGIQSIRVYGLADNVWLWSKRRGFDPRLSVVASSSNEYSIMRTVSMGLNVKF